MLRGKRRMQQVITKTKTAIILITLAVRDFKKEKHKNTMATPFNVLSVERIYLQVGIYFNRYKGLTVILEH